MRIENESIAAKGSIKQVGKKSRKQKQKVDWRPEVNKKINQNREAKTRLEKIEAP